MGKVALQSLLILLVLSVVTGLIYPVAVTVVAQAVFPEKAKGSLLKDDRGNVIGSKLLGQQFNSSKYFFPRPSATAPYSYNASGSSGSNLGPTNEELLKQISMRVSTLESSSKGSAKIPIDLVTASGSGLDPHISVEGAKYQVARVARARGLDPGKIEKLVEEHIEQRHWQVFGEPRVNVLELNQSLDGLK